MNANTDEIEESISYMDFPSVERKVFDRNYLAQVVIELRFPTILRLKEKEPVEIQEQIREQFPQYAAIQKMEMTHRGSTEPEPIYRFADRRGDPYVELSASNIVLTAKKYESFDVFIEKLEYIIGRCLPFIKTDFFTRIGLRYINSIGAIPNDDGEALKWINPSLLGLIGSRIGTIDNMKSEVSGPLQQGGTYRFQYGLSPPEPHRKFILDYDYFTEDVNVDDSIEKLKSFHDVHFDFFWWSIGEAAREALESGSAKQE